MKCNEINKELFKMLVFEKDLPKGTDYLTVFDSFCSMCKNINYSYIYSLFKQPQTNLVFYSTQNTDNFDVNNSPCGLIYEVEIIDYTANIYIMFIATKYTCRNTGYASIFLNEFIDYIQNKFADKVEINIILDSVHTAATFYEKLGFKWIITNMYDDKFHILPGHENEHILMRLTFLNETLYSDS